MRLRLHGFFSVWEERLAYPPPADSIRLPAVVQAVEKPEFVQFFPSHDRSMIAPVHNLVYSGFGNMESLGQRFQRLARRIASANQVISFLDRKMLFRQLGVEQPQNQRSSQREPI